MNNVICQKPLIPASCSAVQQQGWLDEIEANDALSLLKYADKRQLAAIIANSSHLHRMANRFASDIPDIITGKAEDIFFDAQENWKLAWSSSPSDEALASAVRQFRNRCHFVIALSELWGQMDITNACTKLSECAEIGLQGVVNYLTNSQTAPDPAARTSWVILGLGKLGAKELNYSSDIDLIVLHQFSPDSTAATTDKQSEYFISLTRRLAKILSEDTKDGFGWRVDFRLRPDPAATPLSLSFSAAVSYYESTARSWERAAFIRARPVAGNLALGEQFLASISAFIWRRNFDYTVIDDLQVWLRHLPAPEGYFGFDVKLGQFGIRHIELLVHILQLLGGGRHPELQTHNTSTALERLAALNWLELDQAQTLQTHYFQWREIEHRLQYLRDTQTHKLPRDSSAMSDFAAFCGFSNAEKLIKAIQGLQDSIKQAAHHPILDQMVARASDRQETTPQMLVSAGDHQLSLDWLTSLGFARPHDIRDIIDGWSSGRTPATRGERARHYLFRLLPELIARLSKAGEPDAAFARFADFVAALPAGAQAFSLLCQHPQLASLITGILVKAPALTNAISRRTDILDILLEPRFFTPLEDFDTLAENCPVMGADEPAELYLDRLKRWAHEARFRANVHLLEKLQPLEEVSAHLSCIAELCVQAVAHAARQDFEARNGRITGSTMHIIALGRLGCQTLTSRSDIDLLFVYDGEGDRVSDGARQLGLSAYYMRLTQLIISWLTVASREGSLYEVDTRLRPDGKSGPAATHISRLKGYYEKEAWPWEHIAFTKARLIYSSRDEAAKLAETEIQHIKTQLPKKIELAGDIMKMRDKLATETAAGKKAGLNLKKRRGGFLDIEFLAMLKWAELRTDIAYHNTAAPADPLAVLKTCQAQMRDAELAACIKAVTDLEEIQAFSQICLPRYADTPIEEAPSASYRALAETSGYANFNALLKAIEEGCICIEKSLSACLKSC